MLWQVWTWTAEYFFLNICFRNGDWINPARLPWNHLQCHRQSVVCIHIIFSSFYSDIRNCKLCVSMLVFWFSQCQQVEILHGTAAHQILAYEASFSHAASSAPPSINLLLSPAFALTLHLIWVICFASGLNAPSEIHFSYCMLFWVL